MLNVPPRQDGANVSGQLTGPFVVSRRGIGGDDATLDSIVTAVVNDSTTTMSTQS